MCFRDSGERNGCPVSSFWNPDVTRHSERRHLWRALWRNQYVPDLNRNGFVFPPLSSAYIGIPCTSTADPSWLMHSRGPLTRTGIITPGRKEKFWLPEAVRSMCSVASPLHPHPQGAMRRGNKQMFTERHSCQPQHMWAHAKADTHICHHTHGGGLYKLLTFGIYICAYIVLTCQ